MCFPEFRPSLARLTMQWRRPTPRSEALLKSRDCTSCCQRAQAFCRKNCASRNTSCGCEASSCSGGRAVTGNSNIYALVRAAFVSEIDLPCVIQRREIEGRPNLLALHVERLCSTQPGTIGDAIRARG